MKEEGGELVKAVEHEAVLPDDDGAHERTHAENIVGLEPGDIIEKKSSL